MFVLYRVDLSHYLLVDELIFSRRGLDLEFLGCDFFLDGRGIPMAGIRVSALPRKSGSVYSSIFQCVRSECS